MFTRHWQKLAGLSSGRGRRVSLRLAWLLLGLGLASANFQARALALMGPVQPWMQASNGVYLAGGVGGPMALGDGYRWNVPVVT